MSTKTTELIESYVVEARLQKATRESISSALDSLRTKTAGRLKPNGVGDWNPQDRQRSDHYDSGNYYDDDDDDDRENPWSAEYEYPLQREVTEALKKAGIDPRSCYIEVDEKGFVNVSPRKHP
jgi:hypothetical protein